MHRYTAHYKTKQPLIYYNMAHALLLQDIPTTSSSLFSLEAEGWWKEQVMGS